MIMFMPIFAKKCGVGVRPTPPTHTYSDIFAIIVNYIQSYNTIKINYLFQDVCSSYHIGFFFNFVIFLRFIHIYTVAIKVPAIPLQHTDTHIQIQTPYTLIFLNIYCPILFNEFLYYVHNTNMLLLFLFCLFEQ